MFFFKCSQQLVKVASKYCFMSRKVLGSGRFLRPGCSPAVPLDAQMWNDLLTKSYWCHMLFPGPSISLSKILGDKPVARINVFYVISGKQTAAMIFIKFRCEGNITPRVSVVKLSVDNRMRQTATSHFKVWCSHICLSAPGLADKTSTCTWTNPRRSIPGSYTNIHPSWRGLLDKLAVCFVFLMMSEDRFVRSP